MKKHLLSKTIDRNMDSIMNCCQFVNEVKTNKIKIKLLAKR